MKQAKQPEIKKFMLYLDPETMEKIEAEAKKNFRSINGQIRFILDEHFVEKQL